ncbi:hypothetical protein HUT16_31635 [Kitasatospora sp. NA04385]|uniref:hypothetical protein n=1 Tax=Kitasatospora sp. NA04385 TaxID=2742135 RepID=UPI0015915ACC|nr:hypothetical protein [Kitasatospora sp. NA04385]QKW23033.1 hypothetical protein HUT16_31635 [Kitasatospora sp. NA04385]
MWSTDTLAPTPPVPPVPPSPPLPPVPSVPPLLVASPVSVHRLVPAAERFGSAADVPGPYLTAGPAGAEHPGARARRRGPGPAAPRRGRAPAADPRRPLPGGGAPAARPPPPSRPR